MALCVLGVGCRKWNPPQASRATPFQNRIQSETQGKITVAVAVPTPEQTQEIFGVNLYEKGIQPLWIRVTNRSQDQISLLPSSIDPEYFSPNEAAYKSKSGYGKKGRWDREIFFQKMSMPNNLPPQSEGTGYVMTHIDKGIKYFAIDILTESDVKRFTFLYSLPIKAGKFTKIDFDNLYPADEIKNLSLEELRSELEALPCCAPGKPGASEGDPINLVIVGDNEEALSALVRSGWKATPLNPPKATPSKDPSLSKRPYQYKLRTPLWFFDREQDIGFMKPREAIQEKTQFWLWLSPWLYQGRRVWVGTISRDIGLRYLVKKPKLVVTHKIDGDVDETRQYILEDLLSIAAIEKVGWVKGVGASSPNAPRYDSLKDRWYSDGLRLVLFVSDKPVRIEDVEILPWEYPLRGAGYQPVYLREKAGKY